MWKVLEDEVITTTEAEIACDVTLRREDDMRRNNVRRKRAYRVFTVLQYGYLGRGIRKKLPGCVKFGIRSHYPSEDGKYMDHKDV